MEEIIILEHATFWLNSSGILICKFSNLDKNNKLDYKIAKLYIESIVKLCNGKTRPFIIDLRNTKGTFTIAAAQLLSKTFNSIPLISCEAYIVNSLSINLLIHTYKRLYNTNIPFEIFNNESLAEEYSLKYKV